MIVGIGCDIVDINRIDIRMARKILTNKEMEIFQTYKDKRAKEYLASRFCAKEAIFKALPSQNRVIHDIEVLNNEHHKPYCHIEPYKIHVSISHEEEYVIAYAICEVTS